ncbi:transcription antitermination factor NusB [Chloroflexota bacterium]
MTGLRRKARVVALQALYEIDCSDHKPDDVLGNILKNQALPGEAADFAQELVTGVLENLSAINNEIRRFAPLFPIEQIAIIDRNIIRLAIYEVRYDTKVPVKAAINEAVELSKHFGNDTSPKFVNGVLGSVIAESQKVNASTEAIEKSNIK